MDKLLTNAKLTNILTDFLTDKELFYFYNISKKVKILVQGSPKCYIRIWKFENKNKTLLLKQIIINPSFKKQKHSLITNRLYPTILPTTINYYNFNYFKNLKIFKTKNTELPTKTIKTENTSHISFNKTNNKLNKDTYLVKSKKIGRKFCPIVQIKEKVTNFSLRLKHYIY